MGCCSMNSVCGQMTKEEDALLEGYEQNQEFFSLLLDNDDKKRELMQVFLEDVYRNLRDETNK